MKYVQTVHKIITTRLEKKLDENQPREQAGFRSKYSATDHIEEERLLWQINNNTMSYMISFAKETPIKTCNMSLAWEPPYYNDIIILI